MAEAPAVTTGGGLLVPVGELRKIVSKIGQKTMLGRDKTYVPLPPAGYEDEVGQGTLTVE